jgi:hypothetical protein
VVNFVAFKTSRQNNDEGAPYRVTRITAKPNCFSMKRDSTVDGTLPECATVGKLCNNGIRLHFFSNSSMFFFVSKFEPLIADSLYQHHVRLPLFAPPTSSSSV